MINNEHDNLTDLNPSKSSIGTSEEQSQNQIEEENNNEFIRVTAAHEILSEGN
jgi:hypothetical protein